MNPIDTTLSLLSKLLEINVSEKSATTKVTVEIELEHYSSPQQAVSALVDRNKCLAVKSIKVLSAETNYQLHKEPSEESKILCVKFANKSTQ